jgi:type VI secretion system protein ImpF
MNDKYSPSFLDRLIDTHGRAGADHHVRLASLAQIKDNVARDLEALLNTRHGQDVRDLEAFPHSRKSILSFGIADFSSQSLANPNHRREICRSIEQAIHLHEPRLKQVDVSLSVESSTLNRLYFVIKALLVVDRGREQVSFDALLQPLTLQYSISQGRQTAPQGRH